MDKPIDKPSDPDSLPISEKWHLKCTDESAAWRAPSATRVKQDCMNLERVEKKCKDRPGRNPVSQMRTEKVIHFTEKEEDFANLLAKIGTTRNVARVLVFLASTPEATSRVIEQSADLRQSEVSIAMRYLIGKDWITRRESKPESKGRAVRLYRLSRPFHEIMDIIENEKRREATNQLALVQKLQYHLR
jgi:predicted transcriptional regulator